MIEKVLEWVVVICLGGLGLCAILACLNAIVEMIKAIFD